MKFLTLIITSLFFITNSYSQYFEINFEDTTYKKFVFFETESDSNNIWQIGTPNKDKFSFANSKPNALITDTINGYPNNNHSEVLIRHIPIENDKNMTGCWCVSHLLFSYQMDIEDGDSAYIEFSPDNQRSWYKITDTIWDGEYTPGHSLNKNTTKWTGWASGIDVFGSFNSEYTDTFWYKCVFISDSSNKSSRDGWMIDDISFLDLMEDIDIINKNNILNIYPNPTYKEFYFDNKTTNFQEVIIYSQTGILIKKIKIVDNKIDVSNFKPGIYYAKFLSKKSYITKKIIVK